jgi:hypothetical protein
VLAVRGSPSPGRSGSKPDPSGPNSVPGLRRVQRGVSTPLGGCTDRDGTRLNRVIDVPL